MSIKEKLQKGNVKFTVKGQTHYGKDENGEWGDVPKVFEVSNNGESIHADWYGMNVNKWGPTCVTLYTFNMLSKKSTGKIKYDDVTILEEEKPKDIPGFEGTREALDELTIIK